MVKPRERIIGIGFIVISAIFFCIGALIFFDYLRNQSGISHFLPAQQTNAWLELSSWPPEVEPILQNIFPAPLSDLKSRLADYASDYFGLIILANEQKQNIPIYYFAVNKTWQLSRYLGLDEENRGQITLNDNPYYLFLKRGALFLSQDQTILQLIGPQYESLRNDISYQRLHNNLPRKSWGKLYYRVSGLFEHAFNLMGYPANGLLQQITTPILSKMGAVGARLDLKDNKIELTGIQSLPLEKIGTNKQKKEPFVAYLTNFVPQDKSLLFINGQDLVSYYTYTSENLDLNEPLSAQLISLWAKGISQRTGIDWQKDVLERLTKEYGFIIGLADPGWEALIPLDQEEEAQELQNKILFALKSTIPALHPLKREVILPDSTKAEWLVADPAYELLDYEDEYNGVVIKGLRYSGRSQTNFVTAWYEGVLLVADNLKLIQASLDARQEHKSIAQADHFQNLSKDFFVSNSPYIYGNLADLDLTALKLTPSLLDFLARFRHFIARQELLGFDVIIKATLSS